MAELFAGWRLALRRLAANWRLTVLAGIGVVLAATLLAAGPIYADAMSELGLRFRLDRGLDAPREQIASTSLGQLFLGDASDTERRQAMDAVTEARVGWLGSEILTEDRSGLLNVSFVLPEAGAVSIPGSDEPVRRDGWRAPVVVLSGFEDHVTVTEGRLPGPPEDGLEVVLPDGFQRHAAVGDTILLRPRGFDDCPRIPLSEDEDIAEDEVPCRPSTFVSFAATATIVGFVAPNDPDDLRWEFFQAGWGVPDGPETYPGRPLPGEGQMPLLTTERQLFEAFAARFPVLDTTHRVGLVPDIGSLALDEVPRAISDLRAWRTDVNGELGLIAAFRLDVADELESFRNSETFSRVALLVILFQVAGVVLFYVVLVMGLLQDRQSEEASVLLSRGASAGQLVGLTLLEGLVLAVPAAIAAPWLAVWLVSLLGRTPVFNSITGGEALPASMSSDAALLAAAGAAIALIAAIIPAAIRAKQSIVDAKRSQSRPPGRGVLQRYYLDVGAVVLAGGLLWQLDRRETIFDPRSVGGWSGDPLLLLAPLVLTVAAAAIVLRFYPWVLRLFARLLLTFRGTAAALGLRAAGRAPSTQARLMLLVVMAVSVGTFAASYAPTVGRSFEERARYDAGADLRAELLFLAGPEVREQLEAVRALEGVEDATVVHRGAIRTVRGRRVALLAIDDVGRAPDLLWFREDFADEELASMLRRLQSLVEPGGGLAVPDDIVALEVQIRSDVEASLVINNFMARFRDGDGGYVDAYLQRPEGTGWLTARAQILPHVKRPLTFVGFWVSGRSRYTRPPGELFIDDLTAVRASGERVVIEDFEGPFQWRMFSQRASEEEFEYSTEDAVSGSGSLRWSWIAEQILRERVLALDDPALPLDAIMDESAMRAFGGRPGGTVLALLGKDLLVPLRIRAVTDFFPTLDPDGGFVVVNLQQLRTVAGTVGALRAQFANELWVGFEETLTLSEEQQIVALLTDEERSPLAVLAEPRHQAALLADVEADPTLQSAGSGILVVAAASVFAAAVLGTIVTLALSVRGRMVEFAVLRAIGLSGGQLLRSLLLEWSVVIVTGVVLGVLLGRVIASTMLSFLEVTDEGTRVLPPFVLETDWRVLGVLSVGLAITLLVGVLVSWAAVMRGANAAQLRRTQ